MAQRLLDLFNGAFASFGADMGERTIVLARKAMTSSKQKMEKPPPQVAQVRDLALHRRGDDGKDDAALAARLYTPMAAGHAPGPGLLFFHGGGFLVGDLDGYDTVCRRLAAAARIRVLSVAYRLGPEHKFPAAHDDALFALNWLYEHAGKVDMDPNAISLAGDSAGGNLCAGLANWAAAENKPVQAQLLLFPLLQLVETKSKQRSSPEGHILGKPALEAIQQHYADGADLHDPRLSPILARLTPKLPPTLMVTCGIDPLQAEGKAYAQMLVGLGVKVEALHYKMLPHGFLNMTAIIPGSHSASLECFEAFGKFIGTR